MIPNNKVRSDLVLLSYYTKYNKLQEINQRKITNLKPGDIIDIYIDLFDMLKKLYETDIYSKKSLSITASIINLAAHIRAFYRNRLGIRTRIFLIYADELCDNHIKFWPTFSSLGNLAGTINFENTNKLIISQLKLVEILAAYIHDIYYIHKHASFAIVSYDLIKKNLSVNPDTISILMSKSRYSFQIIANLVNNIYQLRPKKYFAEDLSYIVSYDDVYPYYYNNLVAKSIDNISKISPKLMSILWTFNGNRDVNVSPIVNIRQSVNLIYNAINTNRILNDYQPDPMFVYNSIPNAYIYMDSNTFLNRFCALDLLYQHLIYSKTPEALDTTWYINLNDPQTVIDINNKHFIDIPLNLSDF